jgi:membrane protease YdiL (CAAX protease family)
MTRQNWSSIAVFLALVLALSWYAFLLRGSSPEDSGINPLGPLVAALIAAAATGQFRDFVKRIARVRISPSTYVLALGIPFLFALLAVAVGALATGTALPVAQARFQASNFVDGFLIALLFVALGEEPGWRGFLFPALSKWGGPAVAALLICPIWAIWHYPLFGTEFSTVELPPFFVSLVGTSFVLGWLTLRSDGGVLPAMLAHAMTNGIGSAYLFQLFDGETAIVIRWVNALLWISAGIAAAVAMQRGERLDREFPAAAVTS